MEPGEVAKVLRQSELNDVGIVRGPANIIEGHTSIFVTSGWQASFTDNSNIF